MNTKLSSHPGIIKSTHQHISTSSHHHIIPFILLLFALFLFKPAMSQLKYTDLVWPPRLPDGKLIAVDSTNAFLKQDPNAEIKVSDTLKIAAIPPKIEFLYFPGQTYVPELWSAWSDGTTRGSKYYTAISDHSSPRGSAQIYEYDSNTKKLRLLIDLKKYLEEPGQNRLPKGTDYTPGKIHDRLEFGSDGWLYFSSHRGSTKNNTTDKRGYLGDNIYRINPVTEEKEIVASCPMPKHSIPGSALDPKRMIFYGGTFPGNDTPDKGHWFIAYDLKTRKLLKKEPGGSSFYYIFSKSTGCLYWQTRGGEKGDELLYKIGEGRKYDPVTNSITVCPSVPYVISATAESREGKIYGASTQNPHIWSFNVKTEKLDTVTNIAVGKQIYTCSMDLDPVTERYLYYVPGSHGGIIKEDTPIVQFDLKTKKHKILAFVGKYYKEKYGYSPDGTFSTALNADGSILFITWNGNRAIREKGKGWDTTAMMALYIPASERLP